MSFPRRKSMTREVADSTLVDFQSRWTELELPPAVREVLGAAPLVQDAGDAAELLDWALGRAREKRIGHWQS